MNTIKVISKELPINTPVIYNGHLLICHAYLSRPAQCSVYDITLSKLDTNEVIFSGYTTATDIKKYTEGIIGKIRTIKLSVPTDKKVSANSVADVVTKRQRLSKITTEQIRQVNFDRVDFLREQINEMEKEIKYLLVFSRYDSFIQIDRIKEDNNKKEEMIQNNNKHRISILTNYINSYDSKIGAAFVAGDIEKAQMLSLQKQSRIDRANEIINSINIVITK